MLETPLLEAAREALRALYSARAYILSKTGTRNDHRDQAIARLQEAINAEDGL